MHSLTLSPVSSNDSFVKPKGYDKERDGIINQYHELAQEFELLQLRLDIETPGWNISTPPSESDEENDRTSPFQHQQKLRRRRSLQSHNYHNSLHKAQTSSSTSQVHHGQPVHNPRRRLSFSSTVPNLTPIKSLTMNLAPREAHADEESLHEVTQQMKTELTELLNRESVKQDGDFRHWVQGRLMDAEMELRRYRRRRSCGSFGAGSGGSDLVLKRFMTSSSSQ